jgi:hypothetical protein
LVVLAGLLFSETDETDGLIATMRFTPMPTQLSGAKFLASHRYAMLADEPRVGKTGAAIIASDLIVAQRILVITTKSGRAVWARGFADWQVFDRPVLIVNPARLKRLEALASEPCAVVVSWPMLLNPHVMAVLLSQRWDVIKPDEDHYAQNFDAKRTQALYGKLQDDGADLLTAAALFVRGDHVWQLTGTPYPHDLSNGYARLRACAPQLLEENRDRGWPPVTVRNDFRYRYCEIKMKHISRFRTVPVVVRGKNEDEFRERFGSYLMLRTQADVGIQPPRYDFMPLTIPDSMQRDVNKAADLKLVLDAIAAGETKKLEMHLGPLLRLTGEIKATAVVEAVTEEFECGLDRIVLAYWHRNVGDILAAGLAQFGILRIDGSTGDKERGLAEERFRAKGGPRVVLGQIAAAGEAIDLSASAELWFVEQVISPKGMSQMSKRITNKTQTRTPLVKVCTLAGSIDEPIQAAITRLWISIVKGTTA